MYPKNGPVAQFGLERSTARLAPCTREAHIQPSAGVHLNQKKILFSFNNNKITRGPVAQFGLERSTHNRVVGGSNPLRPKRLAPFTRGASAPVEGACTNAFLPDSVCDCFTEGVQKSKEKVDKSEPPKKQFNNRPKAEKKHHKKIWSVGLDRSLSDEEIQRFFEVIENLKHRLCFQLMYYLGLRISEAVKVNTQDYNLELGWFRVYAPKTDRMDALPLKDNPIVPILKAYLRRYERDVSEYGDYLIYGDSGHLSKYYMRNRFQEYREKAGVLEIYAWSEGAGKQKYDKKPLYRFSTHSLRHSYITKVYRETKNPVVTKELARHKSFNTTLNYINLVDNDKEEAMSRTWNHKEAEVDEDFTEFMKFYRMWKQMKEDKNDE